MKRLKRLSIGRHVRIILWLGVVGIRCGALSYLLVTIGCERRNFSAPNFPAPGGYGVYQTSAHEVIMRCMSSASAPDIPAKVVDANWDSRFIIAEQQVLVSRELIPGDHYRIPNPGKYAYWIIDTKDSVQRYGPLTSTEFTNKRDQLGVPKVLVLRRQP